MTDALSMRLASSVMAATEKVVSQALEGAWNEVPRTLQARREMLDTLTAQAGSTDQAWLVALRQAVAESDSAVQAMAPAPAAPQPAAVETSGAGDALHAALRQALISGRTHKK